MTQQIKVEPRRKEINDIVKEEISKIMDGEPAFFGECFGGNNDSDAIDFRTLKSDLREWSERGQLKQVFELMSKYPNIDYLTMSPEIGEYGKSISLEASHQWTTADKDRNKVAFYLHYAQREFVCGGWNFSYPIKVD